MKKKKKLKNVKQFKKKTKITIFVAEVLVALILLAIAAFMIIPNSKVKFLKAFMNCNAGRSLVSCIGKEDYVNNILNKDFDRDKVNMNEGIKKKEGYTNIVLFGIDSGTVTTDMRGNTFDSANSDVMIIVSINNKTSEIRMASIYRDTLLQMPLLDGDTEVEYRKANFAYRAGGAKNSIDMLNMNFDLDITDYAVVNFNGIATIIDSLGGIDVNITEKEREYINGYLTETRLVTGMDAPDVTTSGMVHLNGLQATAFCRIRYTTFYDEQGNAYHDDFGRTARQRFVLNQLLIKAKSAGATQLVDIANTVLKNSTASGEKIIETSLPWDEVLDLIPVAVEASLTESSGFPSRDFYGTTAKGQDYYGSLIPKDLEHTAIELHKFLYDDDNYKPTATLKSISEAISNETGIIYEEPETEEATDASTDITE